MDILETASALVPVVAALGLGTVVGAIYTQRATHKRESHAWTREQQVKAYTAFREALWSSYFRVSGGIAREAYDRADETQIQAIVDGHAADVETLSQLLPDLLTFGDGKVADSGVNLASAWEQWMWESTPLSGTQSFPAVIQKQRALDDAFQAMIQFSIAVRVSLGYANRRTRRKMRKLKVPTYRTDHPAAVVNSPELNRQILIDWRVRNLEGEIPDQETGYGSLDYPWAALDVDHQNFFAPIAAIAVKRPFNPWRLAIEARLPSPAVHALELDAVRLITGHTGAWPTVLRGSAWVPGEAEDERVYLWTMLDLDNAGLTHNEDGQVADENSKE